MILVKIVDPMNVDLTCVHGFRHHGDHRDHDGGDDVEDGEDHVDLDRPLPLRVLPPQPRQTEHCQSDAHLRGRRKL